MLGLFIAQSRLNTGRILLDLSTPMETFLKKICIEKHESQILWFCISIPVLTYLDGQNLLTLSMF